MKRIIFIIVLLPVFFAQNSCFAQENIINHNINVIIDPDNSSMDVTDELTMHSGQKSMEFSLNSSLIPYFNSKNIKLTKIDDDYKGKDVGMDRDDAGNDSKLKLKRWKIEFNDGSKKCTIKYKGKIKSSLEQSRANYQRGFSESPGIISSKGIYLAGSTYWIPTFENSVYTFELNTVLPDEWSSVSQGKRTVNKSDGNLHKDRWICDKPQEEIFLIGAKFTEYMHRMNNGISAMAFLRTPDEGLANKYLEVTEQYMAMDEDMIGEYPYTKFALVENFWETGYGMPSFTLLGEKIIRFPFILHSSYPHELLHNWWGNSVYVDFEKGNWCEGLTAYMADHLIKEQRGQGANYRRSTLQKFTDFVNKDNDFPLSKFLSRYDGASEAIGYGKSLMMFHGLRMKLGDDIFLKGLGDFYKDFKFKKASFFDIETEMEKVSNTDLSRYFNQWVNRKSAPEIALIGTDIKTKKGQKELYIILEQKQEDKPFILDIPVYIFTDNGVQKEIFKMSKRKEAKTYKISGNPVKVEIDPYYDVFRKLNPKEVPPALSKIWASKNNVFVLPGNAPAAQKKIYTDFANKWIEHDNDNFEIVWDNEMDKLPADKTPWILGFENKFAGIFNTQLKKYDCGFKGDSIKLGGKMPDIQRKSFAITTFSPVDFKKQIAFFAIGNAKAIDGFVRKLPHYGKYSYLGFEGEEPVNIIKGQWEVLNSPLKKYFNKQKQSIEYKEERKALGYLKPVFSQDRMMQHIGYLASDELKGRGLGTPELDKAAEYIAGKFEKYGLKPLNDSYYQEFYHKFKDKGKLKLKNVIGVIPGSDPELKESPVVVSAHYDHLGLGWPDVHKRDEGKIHHGADDNASGVAILLELAKTLGKKLKPKRTVIFAAFTGEEAGLIGSRYFVNNINGDFLNPPFADINLDTDGRLFDKKLIILNGNTAREWKFIFMGTDYTTGVKSEVILKELDSSDQFAFIEKRIPAVQLFTGAHQDYHRPTDTVDKIDGAGLTKVATVAKEVVEYLADRVDPMHFTGDNSKKSPSAATSKSKGSRRVSTGSIPDFAYTGKGVRIATVMEGSAGDKAGLKKDDIITAVNDVDIDTLKKYSDELKKYKPGDKVKLKILRTGKEMILEIVLGAR